LDLKLSVLAVCTFAVIALISKYVSLASMCMMIGFFGEFIAFTELDMLKPIAGSEYRVEAYILVFFMAALAVFKHRSNIVRLINGTERKILQKKEGQVG
ncbi:MAG: glycerol-3-phosphate acyltransferase, partial [Lachnospiraceae bacterium]|nr:glycerol-3-phosphate acyltransferase [Lachnospiraceae bacterium]